ncbi:hypothetical protein ATCC90586_009709 [Pythium insidiosum]|nr:hypothetical protein ATCC90586_009709 [Pythium insidiosum]
MSAPLSPTSAAVVERQITVKDEKTSTVEERRLEFRCDWDVGIGGSVWTSGEILTAHLEMHQEDYREIFEGKNVVELGSGTGYVGLMAAATFQPAKVVLTDLASHLNCIQRNIDGNTAAIQPGVEVRAAELCWGCKDHEDALLASLGATHGVDIILGTDIAYLTEFYEPILHTLRHIANAQTLVLIGLNRSDTGMQFFRRLEQEGFEYYKLSDRQLPSEHRGKDFGLFEIRRRAPVQRIVVAGPSAHQQP